MQRSPGLPCALLLSREGDKQCKARANSVARMRSHAQVRIDGSPSRESIRLVPPAGRGRRAERAAGEGVSPRAERVERPLTGTASLMQSDLSPQAGRGGMSSPTRSAIMTLFWRCSSWPFSFRRLLRSGRWQPSVNRFGRRFGRAEGSGNADSQRNNRNRREGGAKRRSRHDFGCVPAHPPSWAPSYLPLRADWARAPGRSGVFEDKRTLQRPSQSARTTQKEF